MKRFLTFPPVRFITTTTQEYTRCGASQSAAALAYFLVLTLFPLLLCLNYLVGFFHLDLELLLQNLHQFLPSQALQVISDYLAYASESHSPTLLIISLGTIVLSASAGLRSLLHTLDRLHDHKPTIGFGRLILSVVLSVLFLVTIYLSLVVIVTGDWFFFLLETNLPETISSRVPWHAILALWSWLRYLLLFCFVLLLVFSIYITGIPRSIVPRRRLRLWAFLTSVGMVGASLVFSWFIGLSTRYSLVYGSLASLIILLVWLYFCGNILILGAVAMKTSRELVP